MSDEASIDSVALRIKRMYEKAIKKGGRDEVHSLIRSKKLIDCIHEFIKHELIIQGVDPSKIIPPIGQTKPEVKMSGFLKRKDQDISVLSETPREEVIEDGVLIGEKDIVGKNIMNKSISINIRSQLSSLGKNFDTLYERTFAEALNLHLRAPSLVMGEVYMVPLVAYDPDKINKKKIAWKEWLPVNYIPAFQALNNRGSDDGDKYKYERVCLLIIDFRKTHPKVIDNVQTFIDEGLIGEERANKFSLSRLTMHDFVSDLLETYKNRHGGLDTLKSVRIA